MTKRKNAERTELKMRLGSELRSRIQKAARHNGVSMNTEMISRLTKSFRISASRTARTNLEGTIKEFQRISTETLQQLARDTYFAIAEIPCVKAAVAAQLEELDSAVADAIERAKQ